MIVIDQATHIGIKLYDISVTLYVNQQMCNWLEINVFLDRLDKFVLPVKYAY
jgi:hypothetical protein